MRNKEALLYIIDVLNKKHNITNWHWNKEFLYWCDTFCKKGTSIKNCRQKFGRYMRLLVESGVAQKEISPLGAGSMNEFGTRTQTSWNKIIKSEIKVELLGI